MLLVSPVGSHSGARQSGPSINNPYLHWPSVAVIIIILPFTNIVGERFFGNLDLSIRKMPWVPTIAKIGITRPRNYVCNWPR